MGEDETHTSTCADHLISLSNNVFAIIIHRRTLHTIRMTSVFIVTNRVTDINETVFSAM